MLIIILTKWHTAGRLSLRVATIGQKLRQVGSASDGSRARSSLARAERSDLLIVPLTRMLSKPALLATPAELLLFYPLLRSQIAPDLEADLARRYSLGSDRRPTSLSSPSARDFVDEANGSLDKSTGSVQIAVKKNPRLLGRRDGGCSESRTHGPWGVSRPARSSSHMLSLGAPGRNHRSSLASSSDWSEEEGGNDDGHLGPRASRLPPPQRLFESSLVDLAQSKALNGSSTDKTSDNIGLLVALRSPSFKRADDLLRALLDEIGGDFVGRLDAATRAAEGRLRELARSARAVDRLIEDGVSFGRFSLADDLAHHDEDHDRSNGESIDGCTGNEGSRLANQIFRAPATPTVTQRHHGAEQCSPRLSALATPPPAKQGSFQPSYSPSLSAGTIAPPSSIGSLVALGLSDIASRSLSLADTLSAVGDQAQISYSSAAESGRRVRALRASMAQIRSEEDAVKRARREIDRWETKRRDYHPSATLGIVGQRVQAEARSVRRAMELFEVCLYSLALAFNMTAIDPSILSVAVTNTRPSIRAPGLHRPRDYSCGRLKAG